MESLKNRLRETQESITKQNSNLEIFKKKVAPLESLLNQLNTLDNELKQIRENSNNMITSAPHNTLLLACNKELFDIMSVQI